MALKITVLKNYLPTTKSPYVVRAIWSDSMSTEEFIDNMAKGSENGKAKHIQSNSFKIQL